jgi:alpha-tubulin suppressor-like RCC1 family protein
MKGTPVRLLVLLSAVIAGLSTMALTAQESITFAALTAGNRFTCALSEDGKAYCWGADAMGQLGIGDSVGRCEESIYAKGACARAPVAVSGDHRFTAISAGDSHTCAIDEEGAVYCWGENHSGQLGVSNAPDRCVRESSRDSGENMTLACSRRPTRVSIETPVVSIATGEYMTCAVDESGGVWCWGGHASRATPTLLELDDRFASIDAGGDDVCGLTVDNALRCWSWAEVITEGVTAPWDSADWEAVTVGMRHGCALDVEGGALCWGSDADGALGIGPNGHNKYDEVPVTPVLGDHRFHSLETGTTRTCAIDEDGALYCWGRVPESKADGLCLDSNGVAGTNDCTTRPVLVHRATTFAAVSIGARHQCGLSTAGVAVCWGANESGQLGDGTLRSTDQPTEVRTGGVTLAQTRLLDARERLVWWVPRGGIGLLVLFGLLVAARRWWRAGAGVHAPSASRDWMGEGALAAVLTGWLVFGAGMLSIGAEDFRGEVGYGLAMLTLLMSGGLALVLSAIAAVVSIVILRRDRRAKPAMLALVLALLTLIAGTVAALMMFWPTER